MSIRTFSLAHVERVAHQSTGLGHAVVVDAGNFSTRLGGRPALTYEENFAREAAHGV